MRFRRACLASLVGCCLAGCASVGTYFRDRALDASDIIDLKGGVGGQGLGVKAEPLPFTGLGLGVAMSYRTTEWFGRSALRQDEAIFIHFVLFGLEAENRRRVFDEVCVAGIQLRDDWGYSLPIGEAFRVGGEALFPFVRGGIYLNFFELADFLAGWFGADLAGDDRKQTEAPPPDRKSPGN